MISTGLPLNSTFIHLRGMGRVREREFWGKGILDWHRFLEAASNGTLARETYRNAVAAARESLWAVERKDLSFFKAALSERELWRLYPAFRDSTLFLDIETTGFRSENCNVTLISTFSNRNLSLFVAGINLGDFICHVAQYSLLVTFNGSLFDLPFLRTHFPEAQLDKAHIDLRYLLASLGYGGGLKAVERAIGLHRDPLVRGISGQDAPKLWQQYLAGDNAALETLALYNLTDAVHLAGLLAFAIREKTLELEYPGDTVTFDSQEPSQSCTEYLSEWLTKHRGRESALEMLRRVEAGSSSIATRQEESHPKNRVPHQCRCVACRKAPNAFSRLHSQMNWFMSKLNKDQRRWFAGLESNRMGKDGSRRIGSITGLCRSAIRRGSEQVASYSEGIPEVRRGRGPGRRPITEVYPDIESVLTSLLQDEVAGDPTSDKQWVRRSSRQLSKELKEKGYQMCNRTVCQLLKSMGFSMRVNVKKRASTSHAPSRDAQFEYIAAQRKAFLAANLPVISVDTKKKELVGNFMAKGSSWCKAPVEVNDYSYASLAECLAVPFGVYDVAKNYGYVFVGRSVDTPEFAATAIQKWWMDWGKQGYPGKTELLILADGGGSNGCRSRAWRKQVQTQLCDEFGLTVTVCHYPPNCSKYNPIERRLFSHISMNWAGKPLVSLEAMLAYVRGTKTATGLAVEASLLEGEFKKGERVAKKELNKLALRPHEQCPAWNYTIIPRTTGAQGNSIAMTEARRGTGFPDRRNAPARS